MNPEMFNLEHERDGRVTTLANVDLSCKLPTCMGSIVSYVLCVENPSCCFGVCCAC